MRKNHLSFWICALALVFALPALAQTQPVRVGGLTCDTGPRVGLLIGSRQRMNCVFRSNTTGQEYHYRGRITRLGVDVGIARGGRLFWGVFAPTTHIGPGALRGTYVGAGGNASLGLGLGANVLVGGLPPYDLAATVVGRGPSRHQSGVRGSGSDPLLATGGGSRHGS